MLAMSEYCGALFWYNERVGKHDNANNPKFLLCCRGGQVEIPKLKQAPKILDDLLFGKKCRK